MQFEYVLTSEEAVAPSKNNQSDSGFDVTLTGVSKRYGKTMLCSTGLKVKPPEGYYFDLVPRSSIVKTGYIQANNVGIIDADYRGEILVPLIKVDETMPDLEFPIRLAQLIPRKNHMMTATKVNTLDDTERSDKGFGSSGKI
jgi:dUTP pyrophosphatase